MGGCVGKSTTTREENTRAISPVRLSPVPASHDVSAASRRQDAQQAEAPPGSDTRSTAAERWDVQGRSAALTADEMQRYDTHLFLVRKTLRPGSTTEAIAIPILSPGSASLSPGSATYAKNGGVTEHLCVTGLTMQRQSTPPCSWTICMTMSPALQAKGGG